MLAEEWRGIEGYPYEVSSEGNVRRIGRRVLKPRVHSNGYLRVALGAGNDFYIHRLVCRAFHGKPVDPSYHADHINRNRADNRVENLRWMSPEDNRKGRNFSNSRRGEACHFSKLSNDRVQQIRTSALSAPQLARELGVSRQTIVSVRDRQSWRHVDAD